MMGCFLCSSNVEFMTTPSGAYIDIEGNRLTIEIKNHHEQDIDIEINFCPICGKELQSQNDKGYIIESIVR